jgi:hypothetical protein
MKITESAHTRIAMIAKALAGLMASEYPAQTEFLRTFEEAARNGDPKLASLYQSLQLWGGAGSIADANLRSAAANRTQQTLLVELHDCFAEADVRYDRATFWADAYRAWLAKGIV